MAAINKPLEPSHDDASKARYLRIVSEEVSKKGLFGTMNLVPFHLDVQVQDEIKERLSNAAKDNPSLFERLTQALSSDLPPKTKGKAIRDAESAIRDDINNVIIDYLSACPRPSSSLIHDFINRK